MIMAEGRGAKLDATNAMGNIAEVQLKVHHFQVNKVVLSNLHKVQRVWETMGHISEESVITSKVSSSPALHRLSAL